MLSTITNKQIIRKLIISFSDTSVGKNFRLVP